MIDFSVAYKVLMFWMVFYITPGPVWVAVMETTSQKSFKNILKFFAKVFLPVNILVQVSQAILSVIFMDLVLQVFKNVEVVFYFLGSAYILYMAFKILKSRQQSSTFQLKFTDLLWVMLLSPKIYVLFPSGAIIATDLSLSLVTNSLFYAISMFTTSSMFFFFYVLLGKVGAKILKQNFSYFVAALLMSFAVFLGFEGVKSLGL